MLAHFLRLPPLTSPLSSSLYTFWTICILRPLHTLDYIVNSFISFFSSHALSGTFPNIGSLTFGLFFFLFAWNRLMLILQKALPNEWTRV